MNRVELLSGFGESRHNPNALPFASIPQDKEPQKVHRDSWGVLLGVSACLAKPPFLRVMHLQSI